LRCPVHAPCAALLDVPRARLIEAARSQALDHVARAQYAFQLLFMPTAWLKQNFASGQASAEAVVMCQVGGSRLAWRRPCEF
jgi:hypothetical protein